MYYLKDMLYKVRYKNKECVWQRANLEMLTDV